MNEEVILDVDQGVPRNRTHVEKKVMSEIQMSDEQRYGNRILTADQVKACNHRHKMGSRLTNLEIHKLLETTLFALEELEHQLRSTIE